MNPVKSICILFLLVAAAGCSTVYDVQFDYNQNTDFANLKTYNWLPVPDKTDIDSLDVVRVQKAVNAEMQAKGLRLASNPDFLIAEHLGKKDKVSVRDWGYDLWPVCGVLGGILGTWRCVDLSVRGRVSHIGLCRSSNEAVDLARIGEGRSGRC